MDDQDSAFTSISFLSLGFVYQCTYLFILSLFQDI